MLMTQTSDSDREWVFINENFEFVVSKSMQELLLSSKHVFGSSHCITSAPEGNPSLPNFPPLG